MKYLSHTVHSNLVSSELYFTYFVWQIFPLISCFWNWNWRFYVELVHAVERSSMNQDFNEENLINWGENPKKSVGERFCKKFQKLMGNSGGPSIKYLRVALRRMILSWLVEMKQSHLVICQLFFLVHLIVLKKAFLNYSLIKHIHYKSCFIAFNKTSLYVISY